MKRSRKTMTYHGRSGHPVVHHTEEGKPYIMVRRVGGGTKRLYLKRGNVPAKYKKRVHHRK